jgi:uncharacterized protein
VADDDPTQAVAQRRHRLARVFYVLIAILCLWLAAGFVATIPVVGHRPYWRTFRGQPGEYGLKAENVSFPATDGIPLKGWWIAADGPPRGTVIIAHGINGNRSDMLPRAAFLVRDGYNALLIDLRDHGESGGTYAGPGYVESRDVIGALQYLRRRGIAGPIAAMGHSYGAVAALYSAAHTPDIAAVICDSGFISFADMVKRSTTLLAEDPERSFWERMGLRVAGFRVTEWAVKPIYYLRTGLWLDDEKANSLAAISRIGQRPVLFIAGENDKICPPQNAQRMYDASRSPAKRLLIVPNAAHDSTFSTDPKLYESAVIDFLQAGFQRAVAAGDSKTCQTCK